MQSERTERGDAVHRLGRRVIGSDGANNDDDEQPAGDLLGEAAAYAVEEPHHSWGGVIDDTRYGAWRSAGFP